MRGFINLIDVKVEMQFLDTHVRHEVTRRIHGAAHIPPRQGGSAAKIVGSTAKLQTLCSFGGGLCAKRT